MEWGSAFSANGTTGTVNITTGNDTLDGIAASINDASIGVSASVVQKTSTNYALVIRLQLVLAMRCRSLSLRMT